MQVGKGLTVGVPRETFPGEKRVALTPGAVPVLLEAGMGVLIEFGAGESAGFPDRAYADQGATVVRWRNEVFGADVMLRVRALGPNLDAARQELDRLCPDQVVVGLCDPLSHLEAVQALAERKVTLFAMDLIPRITRAQSMDALSSQATVAGYKAVILAARALPKMFPMLTTAAGTIPPARVFVVGAGVAGLQAIATAKRLGAVVEAYDIRPDVKEQVHSVGAKFVELELAAGQAQDGGGYAQAMDEDFYRSQRELMARVVAGSDVVITTASVPGRPAPQLVTAEMVAAMAPGSVIVDLAAERGGNCELTRPDEVVTADGVKIYGPTNLPATAAYQASLLYAKNITTFLLHLARDRAVSVDLEDEITCGTLLVRGGEIVHPVLRKALGLQVPEDEGPPDSAPAPQRSLQPVGA
ncbi:MAG: Re/Si-specific NAD(P)(+) transhydrogenase subunit alpha, partial [Actinomycetota bacterium]|nr:Re/Si-specific NAD(P)(+) transhydrogenase subunit alpha [Actinomycetota bacterium]